MRASLRAILAGTAAIVGAAAATPATARDGQAHSLTIQLPNGGSEQIQYTGDVAPQVILAPVPAPFIVAAPMFEPNLDWRPSFAALERISALLGEQTAIMLRQADELPGLTEPTLTGLLPGVSGYSVVSTYSSDGVCSRSIQVTYPGGGAAPRTVSNTSGNCGPEQRERIPAELNLPAHRPATAPGAIQVKASGQAPCAALVQQATWQH